MTHILPSHLQIDTNDYCNLKCVYCCGHNPSPKPSKMSLEMFEKIMSQVGDWGLTSIRPFSRGDPIFEDRIPELIDIIRRHSKAHIYISTNATILKKMEMFVNKEINEVNFTISAATAETYEKVTGKALFNEVIKSLEWFRDNKDPAQLITISFIPNRVNEQEIDLWMNRFSDYGLVISTMHRLYRNEELLKDLEPSDETKLRATYGLRLGYPCNLWNNMGINTHGDIIQCCGGDDEVTYGNVNDIPLLRGWIKRCENFMNNPLCKSCNYVHPEMRKRLVK